MAVPLATKNELGLIEVEWTKPVYAPLSANVAVIRDVYAPPGTTILESITLAKRLDMVEVPGTRGAVAVESVYEPIELKYDGKLSTETPEELRVQIDEILTKFDSGFTLEVLPGRYCDCQVRQHTLDPRWVGASDTLVAFSFQLIVPSGFFYDDAGNTYRTP